ncbi:MAG: pentapeptide repeat-containing protein [Ignavibacteriaceae bacterium]|jgi:uncharacterized protein YjbI with pentapeptide repeats
MNDLSLFEEQDEKKPVELNEAFYNDKEFRNLILTNKELKDKEFCKCKFISCNFFKFKFISCEFENCTFHSCDLSLCRISGSKLLDVTFKGSKTVGVDWREISKPSSFKFIDCKIDNSIFYRMDLRSTNIIKCSAQNVDFAEADLTKAVFTNTDLSGSKFSRTNLSYADLSESLNYRIDPNNNKLKKTIFSLPDALSLLNSFDIIIK